MNKTAIMSSTAAPSSDKLLAAVFIAIIVHVGAILGINFTAPEPKSINKSISITLVNTPSEMAPKKANFLAQENQIGAGKKKQKATPPAHKIYSPGKNRQAKINIQHKTNQSSASKNKLITRKQSEIKNNTGNKAVIKPSNQSTELSTSMLSKQIAEMGIKVRDRQLNAENSRIKFIDSVSAHKFQAAAYINDWQKKVERLGNLNYPAMARKQGFSGKLRLDVGINPDGSIYSIRIRTSSGYKALDDAASNIVRMGAPYAPLPKELRAELDVLVISRVWRFSDETGMSGQ